MTKLISVSDLFKKTWVIYKEKFSIFFGVMAVPAILMILLSLVTTTIPNGLAVVFLLVVLRVLSWLVTVLASIGLLFVLSDRGRTFSLSDIYRSGLGKFLSFIWLIILSFIIGGSVFLLIVPGVILMVWLSFSQVLVVAENEKGMSAIIKSREYVRGYFWPVLGRFIVVSIAVMILYMIISAIIGAVVVLVGGQTTVLGNVIFSLLAAIIYVLATPFIATYGYLLYENLKETKGVVVVDPAKKQTLRYLAAGIAGWVVFIALIVLSFSLIFSPMLSDLFLVQALGGLNPQAAAGLNASTTSSLPASLTSEQQQQLQTQMEAVKKLQDQINQMKIDLPVNTSN